MLPNEYSLNLIKLRQLSSSCSPNRKKRRIYLAVVRVRNHVNPLSNKYQTPVSPQELEKIYVVRLSRSMWILVASKGVLLNMATLEPNWNFLG